MKWCICEVGSGLLGEKYCITEEKGGVSYESSDVVLLLLQYQEKPSYFKRIAERENGQKGVQVVATDSEPLKGFTTYYSRKTVSDTFRFEICGYRRRYFGNSINDERVREWLQILIRFFRSSRYLFFYSVVVRVSRKTVCDLYNINRRSTRLMFSSQ